MWIQSSFDVDGHQFGVSIRRLEGDEGERIAAEMAWFAHRLLTSDDDLEAIGWTALLQRILAEYVALTVDESAIDNIEGMWDQIIRRSLVAFVEVNNLDPALERHLCAKPTLARRLM